MKNELNRHVIDYAMYNTYTCDVIFDISDPIEPLQEYIVQYWSGGRNNAGYGTNYAII